MNKKFSVEDFDVNEFKEQINKLKDAKKEYEKNKGEDIKQPLSQKIIGIIIIVIILIGVIFVLISNLDTLLLPKNSITINITDQNGELIEGLKINIQNTTGIYMEDHVINSSLTILDAEPGDYILTFAEIPAGYTCPDLVNSFTLNQDGKIKLEYECTKN